MKLVPETLCSDQFRKLGEFEDLLTVGDTYSGEKTQAGFFPDVIRLCSNGTDTSISITKVSGSVDRIQTAELHNHCCEGILPLDGDVYIFAAPAFWYPKLAETRLFLVPRGTFVKLKPGVIHGAPISVTGDAVNVMILLPERTYSNDCQFMQLKEEEFMEIETHRK